MLLNYKFLTFCFLQNNDQNEQCVQQTVVHEQRVQTVVPEQRTQTVVQQSEQIQSLRRSSRQSLLSQKIAEVQVKVEPSSTSEP